MALVSTGCIGTCCVRPTWLGSALIQIHTDGALGLEPCLAETLALHTLCIVDTVKVAVAQHCHVHLYQTTGVSLLEYCILVPRNKNQKLYELEILKKEDLFVVCVAKFLLIWCEFIKFVQQICRRGNKRKILLN